MKHLKLFFALFAMLALGVTNAWGAEKTITLTYSDFGLTNSYAQKTATVDGIGFTVNQGYKGSGNVIQMNSSKGAGVLYNTTSIAGLKSITVNVSSGSKTYTITSGTAQTPSGNSQTETATKTFSIPSGDTYFQLKVSGASYFSSIVITYDDSNSGGQTPDPEPEPEPEPEPGTGGELVGEQTATYVISTATAVTTSGIVPDGSSASLFGTGSLSSGFIQCTNGKNHTLTLKGYAGYKIKSISIHVKSNSSKGTGSFSVVAGSTTIASIAESAFNTADWNGSWNNSGVDKVLTMTNDSYEIQSGEDVKLTINCKSGSSNYNSLYIKSYTIVYESTSTGGETPEPETPATELRNDQFAWSAATAEATMGASNTFPTLTNTLPVTVTYESSNTDAATIAANGDITLVASGSTTISAKFAGGEVSGTTYAPKTVTYALTVLKAPATHTSTVYVKVTSTAGITDGEYLIVYEDAEGNPKAPVAFDGSLAPVKLDVASNNIEVSIASNTIAGNTDIDAATFTINTTAGTIQTKDGYYIGQTSNANGLATSTTTKYTNTISIENDGSATIISGGAYLRYNSANDNLRFRYFKSSTYTAQKAIALYKKASSHTLTYGKCTNGSSVSADVADGATVLSGTTITLSNTPATNYKLSAYDVYKTGDETTKVTVTNGKFIMPEFDVTISATFELTKTLTSIEITTPATQTTFWQNETFNHTGLEVTAHFDGAADEVVTPTVTGSTATAGKQTVTVSFTEGTVTKSTSYEITVKAIPNTKETAYTVADAFNIIDKLGDTDKMYITGFVSQADLVQSTIDQYKNADYWISADGSTNGQQLEAYRGKYLDNADFTSVNQIMVGDEVIIYGKLTKYNSTYEFAAGNYLVSLKRDKQQPELSYTTTEYNINLGDAFTAPTLNNPHTLAVTYSSSNEDVATVDETNGAVTIKAAGTVTITASFAGDATYVTGSASYTINITDPSISEATFVAGTDKSEELSISKNGVTVEFTGGTFSRDDNYRCYANQSMTISYNDGQITKIVLAKSSDNSKTPSNFTTEQGTYAYAGSEGVWTGEAKSVTFETTTQVQMNTITVYYKQDTRTAAGLEWSPEAINLTIGDAFTAPTFNNPNGLSGITFASDNEALATVTNAGVVTLKSGVTGKATITAKFDGNSNYKDATVTCTITVNPKTNKVVILAEREGQWYALKAEYLSGNTDRLVAVPVDYFNGTLYNVAEEVKATIEWNSIVEGDKVSFFNDGKYLKGKTSTTLIFEAGEEGLYQWDKDDFTMVIGTTERTFLYNGEAFRNFATSNAGKVVNEVLYSSLPVVTVPVYATETLVSVYTRTVPAKSYGTICLPYAVNNFTGATFYEVAGTEGEKIVFDEVTELEAGKPYIFMAEAAEIKLAQVGDEYTGNAQLYNSLQGTFDDITDGEADADGNILEGNYMVVNNVIKMCGARCKLPKNRAYFVTEKLKNLTLAPAPMPGRRRVTMGVTGENAATGVDNITENGVIAPKKLIKNGQLIIIRNGEKFNVQGQKL